MEKVVHKRLYDYLSKKKLLYPNQYGFRPRHSTINAVTEFSTDTIEAMANKSTNLAIFLDLSKAFDTISHSILIEKLRYYGIRGLPLKWFQSYLSNRKQFVRLNNIDSQKCDSNLYGVPQGSVLGPLLFILYTNDLHKALTHCKRIQFADDTTIYIIGNKIDSLFNNAQKDLTQLADWFKANKMALNINKTNYMLFKSNKNMDITHFSLMIGNSKITQVNCTKFLGIMIDDKITMEGSY